MMLILLSGDEAPDSHMSLPGGGQDGGRDGGKCAVLTKGAGTVRASALVGTPRRGAVRLGYAFQFPAGFASGPSGMLQVQVLTASLQVNVLEDGRIEAEAGSGGAASQSAKKITSGRWYYLEAYARIGTADEARFTVMVDGEVWAEITGYSFYAGTDPTVAGERVLGFARPDDGSPMMIDDLYLDTDPDASDWLGDITVVRLPMQSVADNTGWDVDTAAGTLSGGDPGDAVEVLFDEPPWDEVPRAAAVYGLVRASSPGPVELVVSVPGGDPVPRVPGGTEQGLVASVLGGPPELVGRFEAGRVA